MKIDGGERRWWRSMVVNSGDDERLIFDDEQLSLVSKMEELREKALRVWWINQNLHCLWIEETQLTTYLRWRWTDSSIVSREMEEAKDEREAKRKKREEESRRERRRKKQWEESKREGRSKQRKVKMNRRKVKEKEDERDRSRVKAEEIKWIKKIKRKGWTVKLLFIPTVTEQYQNLHILVCIDRL